MATERKDDRETSKGDAEALKDEEKVLKFDGDTLTEDRVK